MLEIVLFKAWHYNKGDLIRTVDLGCKWPKYLWWFNDPNLKMTANPRDVADPNPHSQMTHIMACEAVRFFMQFVPNPENPIGVSFLADDYEAEGVDTFEEFLPKLVEIAQRRAEDFDWSHPGGMSFYILFDLDLQIFGREGDEVHTNPKWLGELDIEKLPLALMHPVTP